MMVLVAHEKHGERILAADSDEALAQAAFKLLKERWADGWYLAPDEMGCEYAAEPPYSQEAIKAMPEGSKARQIAEQENDSWREYERERNTYRQWYKAVAYAVEHEAEALVAKSSIFTGRMGRKDPSQPFSIENALSPYEKMPMPWVALRFRKDYEYEYVELREVEA